MGTKRWTAALLALALVGATAAQAGAATAGGPGHRPPDHHQPRPTLLVGAASRSVLPTIGGSRSYLRQTPGWDGDDPDDIGVFVPAWDQGKIGVDNGRDDSAWVHDDLLATAMAIQRGDQKAVVVSADLYMVFSVDSAEIQRRARLLLPQAWRQAPILIAATHDHHGPVTAFGVNDAWYDQAANQMAAAVNDAVRRVEPARLTVATGEHRFGMTDGRDPTILDPTLNTMVARSERTGRVLATLVQWSLHTETTLNWTPPLPADQLAAACAAKGWTGSDCTAQGRYFTADFPGVLRHRIQQRWGGEVLYINGAIGSQIGPGGSDVWHIDRAHPVGNGWTVPPGASPVEGCSDYRCKNMARTDEIGTALANAVFSIQHHARPLRVTEVRWRSQPFYTDLTNMGFRLLLASGGLGWQPGTLYTCQGEPSDSTCTSDGGAVQDDPLLTPLTGGQVRVGNVLKSQIQHLSLGDVGFLFLPGEFPPELVRGLPSDYDTNPLKYVTQDASDHPLGAGYTFPGYLLNLVPDRQTFVVGLGGDELGYFVPHSDFRNICVGDLLAGAGTCAKAYAAGSIDHPDAVDGDRCERYAHTPPPASDPYGQVAVLSCIYGQVIGSEYGEPADHYEETNSAGWNLVDDVWKAATILFGRDDPARINPGFIGYTPADPPPTSRP